MKEDTNNKINGLIVRAIQAQEVLNASRREICSEHNERIRKLRDAVAGLMIAAEKSTDEMFDVEATISPEIQRLLADPTHSL